MIHPVIFSCIFFKQWLNTLKMNWDRLDTDSFTNPKLESQKGVPASFPGCPDVLVLPQFCSDLTLLLTDHFVYKNVTYLHRILVSSLLLEDFEHFAIDAQPQHLAGYLVVICYGVLLDL